MRHWPRPELPTSVEDELASKQAQLDAGGDPDMQWHNARRNQSVKSAEKILRTLTGARKRCMYCEDSRGTDIEHFWPKAPYPAFVFRWPNWMWACAGCNRAKGTRFPRDADGAPLLIDPTADDPWDHLFYDAPTGEIAARWHGDDEDAKAVTTLAVLSPLRYQAVCEGRLRASRGLARAVEMFLERGVDVAGPVMTELLHSIDDNDDYGLAEWYFLHEGMDDAPFRTLRTERPHAWTRVQEHLRARCAGAPAPRAWWES